MSVDMQKVESFMGQMIGYMTGATACLSIWMGDELGLYRAMAGRGPMTADAVATATECNARLVKEWLAGQAAAKLMQYDPAAGTYELLPEAAMALADENSPVFLARGMNTVASMYMDMKQVAAAFRGDGAMSWGDHHPCLFSGTEWFFRTGYRAFLAADWIPKLDGVAAKLAAGARVADVGCGHGASVVVMAEAFPSSKFFGFDFHAPSIETSQQRAREAGVAERTEFQVATATSYEGTYDLICFFDCLHDMGDPVGAARHAKQHLAEGGTVLLVEPFALDDTPTNIAQNPMAALLYTASSVICTPNSLSQPGQRGLGAQAGEPLLRDIFLEAGFSSLRRVAQTPTNLILEAR